MSLPHDMQQILTDVSPAVKDFLAAPDQAGMQTAVGSGGAHTHPISAVDNLQTTLDAKAEAGHNHDAAYAALDHGAHFSGAYADLTGKPTLGTAAATAASDYATAAQGVKADSAVQPGGLATVATTGAYSDLAGKPTLGDAAAKNTGTGAGDVAAGNHTHPGGSEAFPVGAVFIAVVSTNPGTLLGYGTWSAFAAGRVLVGLDAGQTEFDTVEETGGAKTHTLSAAEMPAHTHVLTELRDATTGGATTNIALTADTSSTTGTKVSGSTGGGGAHNNLQPYLVVYFWKRTA